MKSLPAPLPTDTSILHKMVHDYQLTVDQMQEKISWNEEQFRLFQQRQFGASSEKLSDQMDLFNEAESILDTLDREEDEHEKTISYQRKKPGRKPLPKHVPRETIRHELSLSQNVSASVVLRYMKQEKNILNS